MTAIARLTDRLHHLLICPTAFAIHAALAMAALAVHLYLITTYVPFAIRMLGSSYLIFFFHFPSAFNTFIFYGGVMGASALYLATRDPRWDRMARASGEVGVLAGLVLLATGSTWAKAAWGHWWVWDDPRLLSAAIMELCYLGYLTLQGGIEEPEKRRRYAAVFGILAFLNIPIVHFAIRWFGEVSHPKVLSEFSDIEIIRTRWFGVLAFLLLYSLVLRFRYDRVSFGEETEATLDRVRRLEDEGVEVMAR